MARESEFSLERSPGLDGVHDESGWKRDPGRESRVVEFANGVVQYDSELNADFARPVDGERFRPSWACEGEGGEQAALGSADVFRDLSAGWSEEERAEMALAAAGLIVGPVGTVVMHALSGDSAARTFPGELGSFVEERMARASDLLGNAPAGFSSGPDAGVLEARDVLLNVEEEACSLAERSLVR